MDILIFSIVVLILVGVGKKLFSYVVPGARLSFLEGAVIHFALGAGSVALFVLGIGLVGILYRWVLIISLAGLSLFSRKDIAELMRIAGTWISGTFRKDFSFLERFMLAALFFVGFFTLIGSLSPILGMDSAAYHMQDSKIFIQQHRVTHIPYTRESLWPFLVQMLFVLGLCLKGVGVAKLFHFAFYTASVAAIYALCRRYWPRQNSVLAAVVFALTPAIFTGTTYAYTDLAVAFYSCMAFYGFFVWLDTGGTRWFAFAGVMSGFLMGIKITSAIVPALILSLYTHRVLFSPAGLKQKTIPPLIFISAMLAICGVWYIRSWIILGNPIYPFAGHFFGGHGFPGEGIRLGFNTDSSIELGPKQFPAMLWYLTIHPERFGGESIGFLYLIFLPMLLWIRKPTRFITHSVMIGFCLCVSWFIIFQYVRFFYPTLIFLSILVAAAYYDVLWTDTVLRKIASGVLVCSFCYSAVLSIYHNADKCPVVFGLETQRNYLLEHERSFAVADYVNTHLPKDAKIIMCTEPRLYYFENNIAIASLIWTDYWAGKHRKSGQTLEDYMIAAGYGDYVIDMQDLSVRGSPGPTFWAKKLFSGYKKTLIKEIKFKYRDERYIYQIMKVDVNSGPKT